jgi:hypothetical protein
MRIIILATMLTLTTMVCFGCGGGTDPGGDSPDAGKADTTVPSKPFGIEGSWLFLGPTGPGHEITISSKSIKYKGTEEDWESSWTIKKYDNDFHHFQIVFESGHGSYYPSGENLSGTYDATETILSLQLAKGLDSYPQLKNPGSCINDGSDPIPDCKLYMKQ